MELNVDNMHEVFQSYSRNYGKSPSYPVLGHIFAVETIDIARFFVEHELKIHNPIFFDVRGHNVGAHRPTKPCANWWDLIEGDEGKFFELQTLYHALSDPDAKVDYLWLLSERVLVEAERNGIRASFSINASIGNDEHEALCYAREVIPLVKRKNKIIGWVLSGLWLHHLQGEVGVKLSNC